MADDVVAIRSMEVAVDGIFLCALAFVFSRRYLAVSFIDGIERVLFPPGGRGSSQLTATTGPDGLVAIDYLVSTDEESLFLTCSHLDGGIVDAMRLSLASSGGLVLIFGHETPVGEVEYFRPSENCIVRTTALLEGEFAHGCTKSALSWDALLRKLDGVVDVR